MKLDTAYDLGNSLKISVCSVHPYSPSYPVTTTNGTSSLGGTSIEVTLGEKFIVGDIITAIVQTLQDIKYQLMLLTQVQPGVQQLL